jgi:hypothetical protein
MICFINPSSCRYLHKTNLLARGALPSIIASTTTMSYYYYCRGPSPPPPHQNCVSWSLPMPTSEPSWNPEQQLRSRLQPEKECFNPKNKTKFPQNSKQPPRCQLTHLCATWHLKGFGPAQMQVLQDS